MECHEARWLLPLLTRTDESLAELRDVRDHLAGCAACQSVLDAEMRSDRELSQRLLAVPVPLDLNARLSRDFAFVHGPVVTGTSARLSRRTWSIAAVIVPLVLLCAVLSVQLLRPPRVLLREAVTAISSLEFSPDWRPAPETDRPAGWSQAPGLKVEAARQVPATPVPVHVVRFTFHPGRSSAPANGHLWIMDARTISDANTVFALEFSQIQYSPGPPHLVWSERGMIYLLEASGNVQALEQLQMLLRKSRSVA